jgi:hypothetical protein
MLDPLLSDYDVEKITGRARSTLQKDRVTGTGIPFIKVGWLVRYRPSDVAAFLEALPSRRSTSETGDESKFSQPPAAARFSPIRRAWSRPGRRRRTEAGSRRRAKPPQSNDQPTG